LGAAGAVRLVRLDARRVASPESSTRDQPHALTATTASTTTIPTSTRLRFTSRTRVPRIPAAQRAPGRRRSRRGFPERPEEVAQLTDERVRVLERREVPAAFR